MRSLSVATFMWARDLVSLQRRPFAALREDSNFEIQLFHDAGRADDGR